MQQGTELGLAAADGDIQHCRTKENVFLNLYPPPHQTKFPVQTNGSVIGQEVEGVIDGTFHDGYLISMNVGGMTLKGMVYESGTTTVPDPEPEEQTLPGQNTNDNDVQSQKQGHVKGKGVKIEPE